MKKQVPGKERHVQCLSPEPAGGRAESLDPAGERCSGWCFAAGSRIKTRAQGLTDSVSAFLGEPAVLSWSRQNLVRHASRGYSK